MSRVLVISGDILPYPGLPTTGAGLRAWGLAKGLESRGHDVLLAMPRSAVEPLPSVPPEAQDGIYTHQQLSSFIRAHHPDVVVLQHWLLANFLEEAFDLPLVIDFHGPLLIETLFQQNPVLEKLKREKIQALHRADFFTCAGEKQKYYFLPWLLLAGFDVRQPVLEVIPVSLAPELPEHQSQGETTFVYGGIFLPWQNPVLGLTTLVECLEHQQRGQLKFFGGKHPSLPVPTGGFEQLIAQLQRSPHVQIVQTIPRTELIQEYCHAHVAIDVMQRNVERELAFTTRTVEYLWCGLPVLYNNYSELTSYIQAYQAGWIVDTQNKDAITEAIRDILDHPETVAERGRNAQRLVRERLTWERTITPLDAFCRQPIKREKKPPLAGAGQQSSLNALRLLNERIQFYLQHEGAHGLLKRIWAKLRR